MLLLRVIDGAAELLLARRFSVIAGERAPRRVREGRLRRRTRPRWCHCCRRPCGRHACRRAVLLRRLSARGLQWTGVAVHGRRVQREGGGAGRRAESGRRAQCGQQRSGLTEVTHVGAQEGVEADAHHLSERHGDRAQGQTQEEGGRAAMSDAASHHPTHSPQAPATHVPIIAPPSYRFFAGREKPRHAGVAQYRQHQRGLGAVGLQCTAVRSTTGTMNE